MEKLNQDEPGLRFAACGEIIANSFLALAIVSACFLIVLAIRYGSRILDVENQPTLLALLLIAILVGVPGWLGYLFLRKSNPTHKLTGTSLTIAGGLPWAMFGEIQISLDNISDVKTCSLWHLVKIGWRHGRVYSLSNFVEIEFKVPIRITYLASWGRGAFPWKANVNRIVTTVANREEFIRLLREKCGLPPLIETI